MVWSELYYNESVRFAGLPWILAQTIPEAPWGGRKVDVMISELLGDSLETVRLRNPEVRAALLGRGGRAADGGSPRSARCRRGRCAASPCRRWTCWLPCTQPAWCTATSSPPTCWRVCGAVRQLLVLFAADANTPQLPLARTGPQQLHIIDFGIAGKIDARGAAQGQNPCVPRICLWMHKCPRNAASYNKSLLPRRRSDGTALYSHRGAALKQPVSFRDDLEALGYTLLALAAGALPWEELALKQLPQKVRLPRHHSTSLFGAMLHFRC